MTCVLVIDDDAQIRRFLTICLGSQGYTIIEAENGTKGAQSCALQQPDLVIMDLGLPDMDGQDLLKDLRTLTGFASHPQTLAHAGAKDADMIIAVTSSD